MTSVIDIEGIGAVYRKKLVAAGIHTTEKLLAIAGPKAGRVALAEELSVSEATVLEWVNRADLMRIKGVGEEYSDLLEAVGVDSPVELARRNAENLTAAMEAHNEAHKIVRRTPTLTEVEAWIEDSSRLEKAVTH